MVLRGWWRYKWYSPPPPQVIQAPTKPLLGNPINHSLSATSRNISISLESDVDYYWRVKDADGEDSSSFSAVFKFYTYGIGIENHPSLPPELLECELNSLVTEPAVDLKWKADDDDTEDTLSFDVYLVKNEDEIVKLMVK